MEGLTFFYINKCLDYHKNKYKSFLSTDVMRRPHGKFGNTCVVDPSLNLPFTEVDIWYGFYLTFTRFVVSFKALYRL